MMTADEYKRLAGKMDGTLVLDTNLKDQVLSAAVTQLTQTLQTKLKRSRTGGKVAVFWCDLR